MDTLGRQMQPAVPAIPPLTQPLPRRPPRRRWLAATAVGLALGLVATGVFAITQSSALSAARQDVADAEDETQASERRVTSLEGKVSTARSDLESANENLGQARDYGNACHAALSGFSKGLRLFYQAVRARDHGDVETSQSLAMQARMFFRASRDSYRTCMNDAPDEISAV